MENYKLRAEIQAAIIAKTKYLFVKLDDPTFERIEELTEELQALEWQEEGGMSAEEILDKIHNIERMSACMEDSYVLRRTAIRAMEEYAQQSSKAVTDTMIRSKALEIVGFDKNSPKTFTQEMAVNFILIFAKWYREQIKQERN